MITIYSVLLHLRFTDSGLSNPVCLILYIEYRTGFDLFVAIFLVYMEDYFLVKQGLFHVLLG